MITSDAQLEQAQEMARRLACAEVDLSIRMDASPSERIQRSIERDVVHRKLARLEADIAEYLRSPP